MPNDKLVTKQARKLRDLMSHMKDLLEFVAQFDASKHTTQIASRLEDVEETKMAFRSVRDTLLQQSEEAEMIESLCADRREFERMYHEVRGFLCANRAEEVYRREPQANSTFASSFNSTQQRARLPKAELPTFDGNTTNWLTFKDRFECLVHNAADVSDVVKLQYLLSSLKGDLAKQYDHTPLTADNYDPTWDSLLKQFDQEKLIKREYFKAFAALEIMKDNSAGELQRVVNESKRLVKGMERLREPVSMWSTPLTCILSYKLDGDTLMAWEEHSADDEADKYASLIEFLQRRIKILNSSMVKDEGSHGRKATSTSSKVNKSNFRSVSMVAGLPMGKRETIDDVAASSRPTTSTRPCEVCKEAHRLWQCSKFASLPVEDRKRVVREKGLCFNCLNNNHMLTNCRSPMKCQRCRRRHHTKLCDVEDVSSTNTTRIAAVTKADTTLKASLLATAQIWLTNSRGESILARALLDSGSQLNIISERVTQLLKLERRKCTTSLTGIGQTPVASKGVTTCTIRSRVSEYEGTAEFLVIPKIIIDVPTKDISIDNWKIPAELQLADPDFNEAKGVDVLLGAEIFVEVLQHGRVDLAPGFPTMLNTKIGWVWMGSYPQNSTNAACYTAVEAGVDELFERFVSLEEIPEETMNKDELECNKLYNETTKYLEIDRRYVVGLPKVSNIEHLLGRSKATALRRFLSIERKMQGDNNLAQEYKRFMHEYQHLGHMTRICTYDQLEQGPQQMTYYMPHHAVWKNESTTTKCRVVFDASCKTTSGKSLNDLLLVGPVLQEDIVSIFIRFRMKPVVLVADVEKMYRQVWVDEGDRSLQRILWRSDPGVPVEVFQLNTITYGTASAPYLAVRTLHRIFEDHGKLFPKACFCKTDFYVDDLLTGADTEGEAQEMRVQLEALLAMGGFKLRKWASNRPAVLQGVSKQDLALSEEHWFDNESNTIGTLGMSWIPATDNIFIRIRAPGNDESLTKRNVCRDIAKIYDPLGLLDPVKMIAKIFLQKLWMWKKEDQTSLGWDEELPHHFQQEWILFIEQLTKLTKVSVPRGVSSANWLDMQLHIFCDASEKGYGACSYIRVRYGNGEISAMLLISKSKVAPIAKRQTLARLELCAAVLGSRLHGFIKDALRTNPSCFLWTDSMTVRHWINASPNRWKTFVANRVAKIQRHTNGCSWRHVPGCENPADAVSRGCLPQNLSSTWWNGPSWLVNNEESWPLQEELRNDTGIEDERGVVLVANQEEESFSKQLCSRYSSYSKLRRVVGYCIRFINRDWRRQAKAEGDNGVGPRWLTTTELEAAERALCRMAQADSFAEDINTLAKTNRVPQTSALKYFHPFIDADGLIRIGGRLGNAAISRAEQFPIVVPKNHPLADLLASYYHQRLLHAGPQLMLCEMRHRFWILGARALVRRTYHQCIRCFRCNPKPASQPMAPLPLGRVSPSNPFSITGVDYCGPIYTRQNRRAVAHKAYIAIFVCFSTRAIHIELVSDLTTEAFLGALRRFIARRGAVIEIHSDNGTNFKGAANQLHEVHALLKSEEHKNRVHHWCLNKAIRWRFIPPRAPNFGGLWEAAVRSTKYHFVRVVGEARLTFEEASTLLAEIECILNSRPITALSNEPENFEALTPGHFLMGTQPRILMDLDRTEVATNRLSRWQLVTKLSQHFWKRWHREYLQTLLPKRGKQNNHTHLQKDMLVLIAEENCPPTQWPLAKVVELHKGTDDVVRVVTVKTQKGIFKRPVSKICILPEQHQS